MILCHQTPKSWSCSQTHGTWHHPDRDRLQRDRAYTRHQDDHDTGAQLSVLPRYHGKMHPLRAARRHQRLLQLRQRSVRRKESEGTGHRPQYRFRVQMLQYDHNSLTHFCLTEHFPINKKSRLTMRRDFYVAYYAFDISALTSSGLSVLLSDRCLCRCQSCNRYTER